MGVSSRPIITSLRCLDDGARVVAPLQAELVDGIAGNNCGEGLVADAEAHLGEEAFTSDFFDNAAEAVAATERDQDAPRAWGTMAAVRWSAAASEKPAHFFLGDAVMATLGANGADRSLVDPPLQCGIGDAETVG